MKKAYLVVVAVSICVLLPLGVIFFGVVNVAASNPENAMVEWLLSTTMKRSVSARARNFDPPDLTDSHRIQQGLSQYAGMCVDCHGAPGVKPSGFIKGLNPPAPILAEEVHEWDAAELFWITKHGVKMTGMPAFGHAHSDDEIWAVVAFLQHMPSMSPEEYTRELQQAGPHSHGAQSDTHDSDDEHGVAQDDSSSEVEGNHEHGDDHGAMPESVTPDDGHEDHDHSHAEPLQGQEIPR